MGLALLFVSSVGFAADHQVLGVNTGGLDVTPTAIDQELHAIRSGCLKGQDPTAIGFRYMTKKAIYACLVDGVANSGRFYGTRASVRLAGRGGVVVVWHDAAGVRYGLKCPELAGPKGAGGSPGCIAFPPR
ncbi:MAG: hypothetical protein JSS53_03570 [Proteobacteria bacterium]|nr:hypothetical protein [Pseudomonadota bacterium]